MNYGTAPRYRAQRVAKVHQSSENRVRIGTVGRGCVARSIDVARPVEVLPDQPAEFRFRRSVCIACGSLKALAVE